MQADLVEARLTTSLTQGNLWAKLDNTTLIESYKVSFLYGRIQILFTNYT